MLRHATFLSLLFLVSCQQAPPNAVALDKAAPHHRQHPTDPTGKYFLLDSLSYLGNFPEDENGKPLPQPVRDWRYVTQLGDTVTNKDLLGQVYVVDFFFTSCPTICPTVKAQMLRIYERFADRENFKLVSFTIDPKRDTPEAMKAFAEKIGVQEHDRWWFLWGDRFFTYELDADYLSIAEENPDAPGGFDHSGYIVLVDSAGYVRAYGSGLKTEEVDHLMENIELLLSKR